jgi:hypothetical protein
MASPMRLTRFRITSIPRLAFAIVVAAARSFLEREAGIVAKLTTKLGSDLLLATIGRLVNLEGPLLYYHPRSGERTVGKKQMRHIRETVAIGQAGTR